MIQRRRPPLPQDESTGRNRELPRRVATAIAVMEMGVSDYAEIASAVGLTADEVRQIDMAEDARIRRLALRGTPQGKYFTLVRALRCPSCRERITLVPCVACESRITSSETS